MRIFILSFLITVYIVPLTAQHTVLYGMTPYGGDSSLGTIIRFDATIDSETVVWSFKGDTDGANPYGDLVTGPPDGLFYGMTNRGGAYNQGIIFSFDPASNTERVLWSFAGSPDGTNPYGDLIYDNQRGLFYGLTSAGGANSDGVIFSFDPVSGAEQDLWAFGSIANDGSDAFGNLVLDPANGLFYGMNYEGGNGSNGTIFSFNPSNDSEQILYNFNLASGVKPFGSLIYDNSSGVFYGMTSEGSGSSHGTIFVFDPTANSENPLWNFIAGSDGKTPDGSLIYDPFTRAFYGMTVYGGTSSDGTIFSFDTTSTETILWSFGQGQDGAYPTGNLTYDPGNGMLYGMTSGGGLYGLGTIFSFDPSTSTHNLLWSFGSGEDGQYTEASLTLYSSAPNGINTVVATPAVSIYPNPTSGIVSLSGLTAGQTIAVYDYLGQKVNSLMADGSSQQINLSTQEAGIYLVTISNRDGSIAAQKKVVKVN